MEPGLDPRLRSSITLTDIGAVHQQTGLDISSLIYPCRDQNPHSASQDTRNPRHRTVSFVASLFPERIFYVQRSTLLGSNILPLRRDRCGRCSQQETSYPSASKSSAERNFGTCFHHTSRSRQLLTFYFILTRVEYTALSHLQHFNAPCNPHPEPNVSPPSSKYAVSSAVESLPNALFLCGYLPNFLIIS